MTDGTKHTRYEATRVQVAQIKCVTGSSEHKDVQRALKKLQKSRGYKTAREAFVACLLEAAKNDATGA